MKTKIMGIINATSDSFHKQSRYPDIEEALSAALSMQAQGADILDIGGESSRPGAAAVSAPEELQRILPLIEAIRNTISLPLSIDTVKPIVAAAALKAGANLINDISGFTNPEMVAIALKYDVDVCVMHMKGSPQTMQVNPHYEEGIIPHLMGWFENRVECLVKAGIKPQRIILDPGIGFGKSVADNLEIIYNAAKLKQLGFPLLVGISRKSFLSNILNKPPSELLSATLAVNAILIGSDVDIIRVHDVKEHRDAVDALAALEMLQSTHSGERLRQSAPVRS